MTSTTNYSFPPASFQPLLDEIAKLLSSNGATIFCGLVSAALLSVPGASKWYAWGRWSDADVKSYLGPTPELVSRLAVSVRIQLGTTYCIGESGATGPTVPGTPYTHVAGRTFISLVSPEGLATRIVDTGSACLLFIKDALAGEVTFDTTANV
ncbi:hypothetical protein BU15DRAFT_88530 [Melanogaster broomeanus]|nr:hypothetical protein BU15DRAFT_88530 [Melanogaster broomeanus]